jgi:hypothetical protein
MIKSGLDLNPHPHHPPLPHIQPMQTASDFLESAKDLPPSAAACSQLQQLRSYAPAGMGSASVLLVGPNFNAARAAGLEPVTGGEPARPRFPGRARHDLAHPTKRPRPALHRGVDPCRHRGVAAESSALYSLVGESIS